MIPVTSVRLGDEEEALVLQVLRSGMLAQGRVVEELEAEFARLHGVSHAVAVNNGTTALVVALEALGIGPGDEVITSPFTFIATLNAIVQAGATARFADIGPDFNIDPAALGPLIGERTRAILPVHLYGYMADMTAIAPLAAQHGLAIVEDAAQAVGSSHHGRAAGSFGTGCFSLYATKNICTGEGGVVTTDDDEVADRLRLLRNQGMRERYQYEIAGHNYRLTDLAAAVGLPQLRRLDQISSTRAANAAVLSDGLAGIPGLVLPVAPTRERTHVYHQYTVRVTDQAVLTRDQLVSGLHERGVGCGIYYPRLVHDYDCYRHHDAVVADPTPSAARVVQEVVSLPVHQHLNPSELDQIVTAVRDLMGAGA
jgi:dTDP-4-amino-4,6-dideoxygalactose transaminase